ncbi:MAG: DNA helicase II [Gammaproteobacteria bacterium]|nr:DNA helicase II [Gammaproteobacteria bacterium]MCD8542304.1 DNA helicase II [Gammaproteobacteria bacterium]
MSTLLHDLNPPQQEAVSSPLGNLMILAGAGSGKTRVLVHRIAWLIQQEYASPFSILAVTFTNKAANEMRARVDSLLRGSLNAMWIGTFHGLAHRLLRAHWKSAGLSENFQILDSTDQQRLIRRVMKDLQMDEERFPYKQVQWFINHKKEEGLRPHDVFLPQHAQEAMYIRIYDAYEKACALSGVVDFSELLLRSVELWQQHPDILQHYRQRFRHILVDEFQDINAIQYTWLRLLMTDQNFFTVVGDDDQLIYSWRGACADNLKKFKREFHGVRTITLEQNYRSTSTILQAANVLIECNRDRFGKQLWTEGSPGEPIRVYAAYNEIDEARFIARECEAWLSQGYTGEDIAILYRSNAQSRVLEEALLQANIPYRIYGGVRFFERAEIKDVLAYLRLCVNTTDDASFERIINLPPRGIGNKTVEILRDLAKTHHVCLWQATLLAIESRCLPSRATLALEHFVNTMLRLHHQIPDIPLFDAVRLVIDRFGLIEYYEKERGEAGRARVENLQEFSSAAGEFESDIFSDEDGESLAPINAFLAHTSLEAGEHQAEDSRHSVKLMTLHAAKGLEFPCVVLCGMEEGLFPHQMSKDSPKALEEERRLCYVGMTRAMRHLLLTYAESRRLYGQTHLAAPSRFLREIPHDLMQEIRLQSKISRPVSMSAYYDQESEMTMGFYLGQQVKHATFGVGTILNIEPNGEKTRVQVRFSAGSKWLMASLAKLSVV